MRYINQDRSINMEIQNEKIIYAVNFNKHTRTSYRVNSIKALKTFQSRSSTCIINNTSRK